MAISLEAIAILTLQGNVATMVFGVFLLHSQDNWECSIMKHRSVDILAVITITIIAVALTFLVAPDNVLGRILTLPLVLVLPGYAVMSAMFVRHPSGFPERLVLSLGLSVMIVVLSGLVLNLIADGLQARSWAVFLGSITLCASVVALMRQKGNARSHPSRSIVGLTLRSWLLLGLAAIVVTGAVAVSSTGAVQQQNSEQFTQLWILPINGAGQKHMVRLGVSNMQPTEAEYALNMSVNGKTVQEWSAIALKPHETWEVTLTLPTIRYTGKIYVEAVLYRNSAPSKKYRFVELWLAP